MFKIESTSEPMIPSLEAIYGKSGLVLELGEKYRSFVHEIVRDPKKSSEEKSQALVDQIRSFEQRRSVEALRDNDLETWLLSRQHLAMTSRDQEGSFAWVYNLKDGENYSFMDWQKSEKNNPNGIFSSELAQELKNEVYPLIESTKENEKVKIILSKRNGEYELFGIFPAESIIENPIEDEKVRITEEKSSIIMQIPSTPCLRKACDDLWSNQKEEISLSEIEFLSLEDFLKDKDFEVPPGGNVVYNSEGKSKDYTYKYIIAALSGFFKNEKTRIDIPMKLVQNSFF